ncbi:MAG: DUF4124 domain-containing protein [Candidatus Accumulibacter sp.]|jgi:hypothetical protein|nr:DUF4124 domain-containing protein [Accumulibacter sp.]
MKRFVFLFAALLVSALAQAQIYQWKDSSGKTIISDKPPTDAQQARKIEGGASSANSSSSASENKSLAEQELEFRKRRKEAQENAEKQQKNEQQAQQQKKYCTGLTNRMRTFQSGERIAMRDDKGERYFLDDNQRAQEIQEMQQEMDKNCQ